MGHEVSKNTSAISELQETASQISEKLASMGQEISNNIAGPATELRDAIKKMAHPVELQERAKKISDSVGETAKKFGIGVAKNIVGTVDDLRGTAKRITSKKPEPTKKNGDDE